MPACDQNQKLTTFPQKVLNTATHTSTLEGAGCWDEETLTPLSKAMDERGGGERGVASHAEEAASERHKAKFISKPQD